MKNIKTRNFILSKFLFLTSLIIIISNLAHADNIFVSFFERGTIQEFDSSKNGSLFASGLISPQSLAFDSSGNLYVAMFSGAIDKIDPSGNRSTFASGFGNSGGAGLAFDSSGNLYSSHQYSGIIEKFDSNGHRTVFASGLNLPEGLAFDNSGNLYVALRGTGEIVKFDLNGKVSTFKSGLTGAVGLTLDEHGNLFVSLSPGNAGNGTVEKVDMNGNRSTFATGLNRPLGLAFDRSGNLYVADFFDKKIVKIGSDGTKSTFANLSERPWGIAIQISEPIADAGEDITAFADWTKKVSVTLDGSASSDEDGDTLTYLWTWSIDGVDYQAEGVKPTIELPVGEHVITLVVDDGQADSEPDTVLATIREMMVVSMQFTPSVLNPKSNGKWVKAHLVLPDGYVPQDVDVEQGATVYPTGLPSDRMIAFVNEQGRTAVEVNFLRSAFSSKLPAGEPVVLHVMAYLVGGEPFYGTDTIQILDHRWEKLIGLASHWLQTGDETGEYDLDGNSPVNLRDFALLTQEIGAAD